MDLRLHAPRPDVVIVRVNGPVITLNTRVLAELVGKQLHRAPHVVIDLGEVRVLGPRGVAVLSTLYQQAMACGTQLHVAAAGHDAVRRVLHAAGLARLPSLESTADEVIAALPGPVISRVGAARIEPESDEEDPMGGVGHSHPRLVGPRGEHHLRSRAANAISPDPAIGHRDGGEASEPRHPPTQRDHTDRAVTACLRQWQDAELAMNLARRCFEGWRLTHRDQTPPSMATRHAYHTREALHDAVRALALLSETFRVEVLTRAITPAGSPVVPPAVE